MDKSSSCYKTSLPQAQGAIVMTDDQEGVGTCNDCNHVCHCGRTDCAGPEHCKCVDCKCKETSYAQLDLQIS